MTDRDNIPILGQRKENDEVRYSTYISNEANSVDSVNSVNPPFPYMGGKRSIAQELITLFPSQYETYYEPFLGGGAVLFALNPKRAVISDLNWDVTNVFRMIKYYPVTVVNELKTFVNTKEEYLRLRNMDRDPLFQNTPDVFRAARFIALSKMAFGNSTRYNAKGYLNQSYGNYSTKAILDEENIYKVHKFLINNDIDILNTDYRNLLTLPTDKDFVYLDPPYHDLTYQYYGKKWKEQEQIELKNELDKLTSKGIRWLMTNNNTDFIRNLFSEYILTKRDCLRPIATVPYGTTKKAYQSELIIQNYTRVFK